MKSEFNIVIVGVGGQGVLTIAGIIARTALRDGYDIKASELHGLAMRFGSLQVHLRLGKKIMSPLVSVGSADLIISHEPIETVRAAKFANKNTVFMFDTKKQVPTIAYIEKSKYPSLAEIKKMLKKFSKNIITVDASKEVENLTGKTILTNTYILGRLAAEEILPLKKNSLIATLKEIVPKATIKDNLKIFELGFRSK